MVPSPGTRRWRIDKHTEAFHAVVSGAGVAFLENVSAPCAALDTSHVALEADVTPFDNSQVCKEGVTRTYKG